MPDITVSLTDAQWARVVAASTYIKGTSGDITTDELAVILKTKVEVLVKHHEIQQLSVADF